MTTERTQPRTPDMPKYAAFISYRHLPEDTKVARMVQRAIESYRLPWEVAQDDDRRLGRCFRDEDELSASPSLPASIRQALADSHSLIVICSPDTVQSDWVNQEIETYIALHGHDRIITVLANGTSQDSIPPVLRNTSTFEADDALGQMPLQPLAADLRPSARARRRAELLRIIAAVSDRDYDQLRRRDRIRRCQHFVALAAVATIAVAALAALSMNMFQASKDSYIEHAKVLATESRERFDRGERIEAIKTALEALPESESEFLHPVVPEARAALEEALLVSIPDDEFWTPYYAIHAQGEIIQFTVHKRYPVLAVLDASSRISLYSAKDGAFYLTINLADHAGEFADVPATRWRMAFTAGDELIVGCSEQGGPLLCFDFIFGTLQWKHDGSSSNTLSVSEDGAVACSVRMEKDAGIRATFLDVKTGNIIKDLMRENPYATQVTEWFESCMDSQGTSVYVNFGAGSLRIGPEPNSPSDAFLLGTYHCGSIALHGNHVVAGGYSEKGTVPIEGDDERTQSIRDYFGSDTLPGIRAPFTFVCNQEGRNLWQKSDLYDGFVFDAASKKMGTVGKPAIRGFSDHDVPLVVLSAGVMLATCDLDTGEVVQREEFPSPIVGLDVIHLESKDLAAGLLENGSIVLRTVGGDETASYSLLGEQVLPYAAYEAQFWNDDTLRALVQPFDSPESLIGYFTLPLTQHEETDLTFDELLDRAQSELNHNESYAFNGVLAPG